MNVGHQSHREPDQRNIEESDDAVDGADDGAALAGFDGHADGEVDDVQKPEDEAEGESRAPGPPLAPGALAPDHAGEEDDGAELDGDAGRGGREIVPPGFALHQIADAGDEADEAGEEGA